MERLFAAVRQLASPRTWSAGVEVSRSAELLELRSGVEDERSFRLVLRPQKSVVEVQLSETLESWQCTCREEDDPCRHVIGAVIALRHERNHGKELVMRGENSGRIVHAFHRVGRYLSFERYLEVNGKRTRVFPSLAIALKKVELEGQQVFVSEGEQGIDHILSLTASGPLDPKTNRLLLMALTRVSYVELDGAPCGVLATPIDSVLEVLDDGDGFRIRLLLDAEKPECFENGLALTDGELRSVADTGLSADEYGQFKGMGKLVSGGQRNELAAVMIPRLRCRIEVRVRTRRLPSVVEEQPRLVLESVRSQSSDTLAIVPRIVYGTPIIGEVAASGFEYRNNGVVPARDVVEESRLARDLKTRLSLRLGEAKVFRGEEGVEFLKRAGASAISGEGASHFTSKGLVNLTFTEDGRDLSFAFKTKEGALVSAEAVLEAWRAGQAFVRLGDGGWGEVPTEWMESHREALLRLFDSRDHRDVATVGAEVLSDVRDICESLSATPPQYLSKLLSALNNSAAIPEAPIPEDLTATLRPYQREGVNWLSFLRDHQLGALLADDMGLGKTLQAICSLRAPALVVCPTSVLFGWEEQIKRFRPELRVACYHGNDRALPLEADVTLTTYGVLRLDVDILQSRVWSVVVLDESQVIKNSESQVARAACQLNATWRLSLSGTPIENSLGDLWSQMNFLNPGLLGTKGEFDVRFGRSLDGVSSGVAALKKRVSPFILRRLKREVATELPPKTEVVLSCELSYDERVVYDAVLGGARREILEVEREKVSPLSILEVLLRLRQACCHTALIPGQRAAISSKVALLVESLHNSKEHGHRSLVFSQWTSLLDLIEPELAHAGLTNLRIDGGTIDRESVVNTFQREDGPDVLLLSLKAGGVGLNLTAADHVYIVDPWWNPAVEDQAADRAYRIGQSNPVLVHRLVAQDTVEEKVLALQAAKRSMMKGALGEGGISGLSIDDIREILS